MSAHGIPTPSRRIWSTYELAFIALFAFAIAGILAGVVFAVQGVPLDDGVEDPTGGFPGLDSLSSALPDGLEVLGALPRELSEASGLAVSRTHSGVLWVHNDDPGAARLYALDFRGRLLGSVTVSNARMLDFEDLGLGPCPLDAEESCLYLADTGDNNRVRRSYTIVAVSEPNPRGGAAGAPVVRGTIPFTLEGGVSRDMEALAVGPDRRLYLITKGQEGSADLYELDVDEIASRAASGGAGAGPVEARFVATLPLDVSEEGNRVSGAAMSFDGQTLAIRTGRTLHLFATDRWGEVLTSCEIGGREPQGEAVAFAGEGHFFLAGEAAGAQAPLLRLRCP